MPGAVLPADDEPVWPAMKTAREGGGRARIAREGERLVCEVGWGCIDDNGKWNPPWDSRPQWNRSNNQYSTSATPVVPHLVVGAPKKRWAVERSSSGRTLFFVHLVAFACLATMKNSTGKLVALVGVTTST